MMMAKRSAAAPSALHRTESEQGTIWLDRDLQIELADYPSSLIIGHRQVDLIGLPIEDLTGFSYELRTLKTRLAMAAPTEPLAWTLEIDGHLVQAEASLEGLDRDARQRRIVLRLAPDRPMGVASDFVRSTERIGRRVVSTVMAGVVTAPFALALGIWLASVPGESRSDGDVVTAELQSGMDETFSLGAPEAPNEDASFRRFVGQVTPGTSVAGVAPLDGNIVGLEAPDFGVFVEKGELLVTLDPGEELEKSLREAKISVIEARSEVLKLENWSTSSEMRDADRSLKEAERDVERAELERDRTKLLFDDGIVAASEYESAEELLESAQSQLQSTIERREETLAQGSGEQLQIAEERFEIAQATYDALLRSKADREVHAPISGIMLPAASTSYQSSELAIGQKVEKGTALFLVGDLDEIIVQTSVSEFDIDLIKIGQKAVITTPAQPNFKAVGEVVSISQISSSFGDMSGFSGGYTPPPSRYDVAVKIVTKGQELNGKIRIGMTVDVEIDTAALVASNQ